MPPRLYLKRKLNNKVKSNDNSSITRKSTRFLGKPRVVYSKRSKNAKSSRILSGPRPAFKAPYAYSTPMNCDRLCFRGIYYQIGDIVGLKDSSDGKMYYAQIRGFLNDQYSDKSAIITWLLPSSSSPPVGFDPSSYFLGPEEDIPRKLEYMEFICHAPSDYYRNPCSPYPTLTMKPETGFIWTRFDSGDILKLEDCKKLSSLVANLEVKQEAPDEGINIDGGDVQKEQIIIVQDYKKTDVSS